MIRVVPLPTFSVFRDMVYDNCAWMHALMRVLDGMGRMRPNKIGFSQAQDSGMFHKTRSGGAKPVSQPLKPVDLSSLQYR